LQIAPTQYSEEESGFLATCYANRAAYPFFCLLGNIENVKNICKTRMKRLDSSTCLHAVGDKAVEFFFASDAR
jgi:hypothetical protein